MTSRTTERFREHLAGLPSEIRAQARESYRLFQQDPNHPSLRFKRVHPNEPIYSARVGQHYRAVGILEADMIVWYWIGSHAAYDALLRRR